jgi:hypothetical protein
VISTLIVEDDYHVATIHAAYVRKVRGFARGLIRQDLDATWLFDVLVALITHTVGHTRNDPAQRSAMLHATVSSVLKSPPGA